MTDHRSTAPRISRRALIASAGACIAPSLIAQPAFPSKTIRIVVGFPPGGIPDILGRMYAQHLSPALGVPVIVENRPGALQMNAVRALQSSAPDGHTFWLTGGAALALTPAFEKDLAYDPMKDFTYIAMISTSPAFFVVANDIPVNTFPELIEYSKKNPGKLNYGSAGKGASNNIKLEYLKVLTGLNATHVPYKSDAEWLREVAAGTVHLGLGTAASAAPLIAAGRIRAVGVTSPEPHPAFPNVPGTAQMGIKGLDRIDPYTSYGIVGPAGIPPAVVDQLNKAINRIVDMPNIKKMMVDTQLMTMVTGSPSRFREFTAEQLSRAREWSKMIGPL